MDEHERRLREVIAGGHYADADAAAAILRGAVDAERALCVADLRQAWEDAAGDAHVGAVRSRMNSIASLWEAGAHLPKGAIALQWPREIDLQAPTIMGRDRQGRTWTIRREAADDWSAAGPDGYLRTTHGRVRVFETALQAMAAVERALIGLL